jgi:hypothetical protein
MTYLPDLDAPYSDLTEPDKTLNSSAGENIHKASIADAAQKTVEYLYALSDDCPKELRQAIDTLRQITNEEFVHKDKSISSQLIWDLLKPAVDQMLNNIGDKI